jgi:hypothetical protein
MNNATVFALSVTVGIVSAFSGVVIGRLTSPAREPVEVRVAEIREVVREVPVVKEVIKEVRLPPDQDVIDAAVNLRMARANKEKEGQFWESVSNRLMQISRQAAVMLARPASNTSAANLEELQRAIAKGVSSERAINLQVLATDLYLLLGKPSLQSEAEPLVRAAYAYVLEVQVEAGRMGYIK